MSRLVLLCGALLALVFAGCSKEQTESETEPPATEGKTELSKNAKTRRDCEIAWPIFERDQRLTNSYKYGPSSLDDVKPRAKEYDQMIAEWRASSAKLQTDEMGKQGSQIVALLKLRLGIYQRAIERAEKGEPVPSSASAQPTGTPQPKRPLTEREKALKDAAEFGLKGLLGDGGTASTILSTDEHTLLRDNRRGLREARSGLFDLCFDANYQPKERRK